MFRGPDSWTRAMSFCMVSLLKPSWATMRLTEWGGLNRLSLDFSIPAYTVQSSGWRSLQEQERPGLLVKVVDDKSQSYLKT